MCNPVLGSHSFVFDPKCNGGESVSIETQFIDNGDLDGTGSIYLDQEIKLQSYSNSASIFIGDGGLTPERLRILADELEKVYEQALDEQKRLKQHA